MQPVLTAEQMREVDAGAVASGTPLATLVERAGTVVACEAIHLLGGTYGRRVVVVAGPGNNGADGRMAAALLARRGVRTTVVDAREAARQLPRSDLVIDAAFGTGFHGEYSAPATAGAGVLAVDIPTGVDADTGAAGPDAVTAVATVTFGAWKPGLLLGEGRRRAGRVTLHRIGLPVPPASECDICLVEDDDIVALVPARAFDAYKWQTAIGVVAGSPGMYGAPAFVSHAAARAGAGMVRLGIPGAEPGDLPISEAVSRALPMNSFDEAALDMVQRCKALVVGPGLGPERPTRASVRRLVTKAPVPIVIDADALTALGEESSATELIAPRTEATILTPHEAEFARLTGAPPGSDRLAAVRSLAAATGAVVLLKGSTTVVAEPGGRAWLASSGSRQLATAGTGDVLSGVIAAFLARGMPAPEAAAIAAHVHGRAGDSGFRDGLVAGDLADLIAAVLSRAEVARSAPHAG